MSEQEIRRIIRSVCADLDQRARRAAQSTVRRAVLPTVVGLGLAVSGCSNEVIERGPTVPQTDGEAQDGEADAANDSGGAVPLYSAPAVDSGPQVEYMAPMPDGALPTDGATPVDANKPYDAGPAVKYMAPQPDTGVVPLYGVPLYLAPSPR